VDFGGKWAARKLKKPRHGLKVCQLMKVDTVAGVAFSEIVGQGDTWDEAYAAVEMRKHGVQVSFLERELEVLIACAGKSLPDNLRARLAKALARAKERERG
jgi:hypothetical protein